METLAELRFQNLKCENSLTSKIDCFRQGRDLAQIMWLLRKEQDTRCCKCSQPGLMGRGGFLMVLVRGYTAGQGRRRPPGSSCLCSGKKPVFPSEGSWQGGQGRRVMLSGAHLCWESKVAAHSVAVVIFLARCTISFLFFSPLGKRVYLLGFSLRALESVN